MNLILNGADAIEDTIGTVFIMTRTLELESEYKQTIEPIPAGRYVTLTVADTGKGMDQETLHRIFDPFFTTKPTGRGLGLASVLGIVRSHHGGLEVESKVDEGTRFKLYFPALPESSPPEKPAPEAVKIDDQVPPALVLIVEDEDMVRTALIDIVTSLGHDTLRASNGWRALALLSENLTDISLIILDINMPGMGGIEAWYHMRDLNPTVPIILTSAYTLEESLDLASKDARTYFVAKPYDVNLFSSLVQQALKLGGDQDG